LADRQRTVDGREEPCEERTRKRRIEGRQVEVALQEVDQAVEMRVGYEAAT